MVTEVDHHVIKTRIKDIIKAVENVYDNDTAFTILKDFERVLDEFWIL